MTPKRSPQQEVINPEILLVKVASILESLKLDYFVTGSFALSIWGRPRATFDIDVVIKLIEPQVKPLAEALRSISILGYINEDAAKEAIREKGEFNFIDPETGLKVDFWVTKNDPLAISEFKRKKQKKIDNQKVYFISPEDLILNKLKWYKETGSERQLRDVESVLKISDYKLDKKYLREQAKLLEVFDILTKII